MTDGGISHSEQNLQQEDFSHYCSEAHDRKLIIDRNTIGTALEQPSEGGVDHIHLEGHEQERTDFICPQKLYELRVEVFCQENGRADRQNHPSSCSLLPVCQSGT